MESLFTHIVKGHIFKRMLVFPSGKEVYESVRLLSKNYVKKKKRKKDRVINISLGVICIVVFSSIGRKFFRVESVEITSCF